MWSIRSAFPAPLLLTLAWLASASAVACSKPAKALVTDTEGRTFSLTCERGGCKVETNETPSPTAAQPEGGRAAFVFHQASRLYSICEAWVQGEGSFSTQPSDCRALTCRSDADCPPAQGLMTGSCVNDLCIEPSGDVSSEDAIVLCLAGTGRPAGSNQQVERVALGTNCGVPCRVPSVCRQP